MCESIFKKYWLDSLLFLSACLFVIVVPSYVIGLFNSSIRSAIKLSISSDNCQTSSIVEYWVNGPNSDLLTRLYVKPSGQNCGKFIIQSNYQLMTKNDAEKLTRVNTHRKAIHEYTVDFPSPQFTMDGQGMAKYVGKGGEYSKIELTLLNAGDRNNDLYDFFFAGNALKSEDQNTDIQKLFVCWDPHTSIYSKSKNLREIETEKWPCAIIIGSESAILTASNPRVGVIINFVLQITSLLGGLALGIFVERIIPSKQA